MINVSKNVFTKDELKYLKDEILFEDCDDFVVLNQKKVKLLGFFQNQKGIVPICKKCHFCEYFTRCYNVT